MLPTVGQATGSSSWQEAKPLIERAISRHGRDGRAVALRERGEQNDLLVQFVDRVRWAELCEQPMRYAERRYAEIWGQLTRPDNHQGEQAA
jgi:hypothetical protein